MNVSPAAAQRPYMFALGASKSVPDPCKTRRKRSRFAEAYEISSSLPWFTWRGSESVSTMRDRGYKYIGLARPHGKIGRTQFGNLVKMQVIQSINLFWTQIPRETQHLMLLLRRILSRELNAWTYPAHARRALLPLLFTSKDSQGQAIYIWGFN